MYTKKLKVSPQKSSYRDLNSTADGGSAMGKDLLRGKQCPPVYPKYIYILKSYCKTGD